jgi:hypothetical protein
MSFSMLLKHLIQRVPLRLRQSSDCSRWDYHWARQDNHCLPSGWSASTCFSIISLTIHQRDLSLSLASNEVVHFKNGDFHIRTPLELSGPQGHLSLRLPHFPGRHNHYRLEVKDSICPAAISSRDESITGA